MLQVTDDIQIDESEIQFSALYSSGPGGQHVNKTMSAIQLRFAIINSRTLPADVQQRLIRLGGSRVNNNFELVMTARSHRSQERNRRDVLERFFELVRKAAQRPKIRLKRRRSRAENQSRLDDKRKHADRKVMRRGVRDVD